MYFKKFLLGSAKGIKDSYVYQRFGTTFEDLNDNVLGIVGDQKNLQVIPQSILTPLECCPYLIMWWDTYCYLKLACLGIFFCLKTFKYNILTIHYQNIYFDKFSNPPLHNFVLYLVLQLLLVLFIERSFVWHSLLSIISNYSISSDIFY